MFGQRRNPDKRAVRRSSSSLRKSVKNGALPNGARGVAKGVKRGNIRANPPRKKEKSPPWLDWGRVRLWTVGVVFSLLWLSLWGRAYYLQIVMGPEYAAMARRQHTAKEEVRGVRGSIVDRNGNVMARSVECFSVWVNPSRVRDIEETAAQLATVLGKPAPLMLARLQERKQFVWLQRKVDYNTAENVKALALPGVYLDVEYQRVYPYQHLAGQLLGFVNIDDAGIEGLEKSFEADLSGRRVVSTVERDAAGRRLVAAGTGSLADLGGRDLRLTIDTQVQFFAEQALSEQVQKFEARWGGCMVVDVPTGDVLAWAQYPFFDPNNVSRTTPDHRRNRLASDALEQGSTIKSFLVAAALEEGVVKPDSVIYCENGQWKLGRFTLHDTHSYGKLTVDKILHVSSNIGAAKIGQKLGAKSYHSYLSRLGFGKPTGLPLTGESRGILREPGRWAEIDVAASSFGQSFSATLSQMAKAYLCLAGGGVSRPLRLVMDDSEAAWDESGRAAGQDTNAGGQIFSPGTMQKVRDMLREVVEEEGGTGKQARIPGMMVGGKTGTAQKADTSGKYGKGRVGSFVGMIPVEEPRYLICVLLDEPARVQYGGVVAAPVFRDVALDVMAYHGLLPDTDDPLVKAVAQKAAAGKAGKNQKPKPGKMAAAPAAAAQGRGATTSAKESGSSSLLSGTVPTVVGLGVRNAVEILAGLGIVPEIKGRGGIVVRQTPDAGSNWPDSGKTCTLWLEELAL